MIEGAGGRTITIELKVSSYKNDTAAGSPIPTVHTYCIIIILK